MPVSLPDQLAATGGDAVRVYDEVGVVVHGDGRLLPVIADLARTFAQHRFTVTDLTGRRTCALEHRSTIKPVGCFSFGGTAL